MRTLILLAVVVGCGDDDSGSGQARRDAAVDGQQQRSCSATAACTTGPQCGTVCCAYGEHCSNGACMCGDNAACLVGDSCVTGGPVTEPADAYCGLFCCGPTSGVGCPI